MKRFKAAIASETGSYTAVGMTYDNQQYYPQYDYSSSHVHTNTPYYPAYGEELIIGMYSYLFSLE